MICYRNKCKEDYLGGDNLDDIFKIMNFELLVVIKERDLEVVVDYFFKI